jgi:hypothetical protein
MGDVLGKPVNSEAVAALENRGTITIYDRSQTKVWTLHLSTQHNSARLEPHVPRAFRADKVFRMPASQKNCVEYRGRTGLNPNREFRLVLNRINLRTFEGKMYEGLSPFGVRLIAEVVVYIDE